MRAVGRVRSMERPRSIALPALVAAALAAGTSIQERSRREASPATFKSTDRARVARMLESQPLGFEPNRGQFDAGTRFVARGLGYDLKLSPAEATMDLGRPDGAARPVRVRMTLVGANPNAQMRGSGEQPGKRHYFRGNDPIRWLTNIPSYTRVAEEAVYPGIDLVYYGRDDRIEWDFLVAPGTDPAAIRFRFAGAGPLRIDDNGDLVLETPAGLVRQKKPALYQEVGRERRSVEGAYALYAPDEAGFAVGAYDRARPLVIDPELVYSTYVAGCRGRQGLEAVAVDSTGNAYAAGYRPLGCDQEPSDAWVVKFTPDGTWLASTHFGGVVAVDAATGIALDADSNVYVTGWTNWSRPDGPPPFPITPDALQTAHGGVRDAFVVKLSPSLGDIRYSTFLGGSGDDIGTDIVLDQAGTVYVAGWTASTDFPTANPAQPVPGGGQDAFVSALDLGASSLVFSSYLGGTGEDWAARIAPSGSSVVVAGTTRSPDLPVHADDPAGPVQPSFGGGPSDAFAARYSASGTLEYLTYLGGSDRDEAYGVAADCLGFAYVTGGTASPDYPTRNPLQAGLSFPPEGDAFVTKLDPAGSGLEYSTYLEVGGDVGACVPPPGQVMFAAPPFGDQCGGIAVGAGGEAYVTAKGVFAAKLDPSGASRVYTFNGYGGNAIVLGPAGQIIVSGKGVWGSNLLFPTVNAADPYANTYEFEAGRLTKLTDGANPGARFEQDDPAVTYAGTWDIEWSPEHSGGSSARSMEAAAQAVITFSGTGIQLIGERAPCSGIVRVSLDEDQIKQDLPLDTYAAPAEARSVLLSFSGLPSGPHTLKLEVAGAQNGRSSGAWVSIDGFNVLGAPEPEPTPTPTPTPEPTPTATPLPLPLPSLLPSPLPSLLPPRLR